MVMINPACIPPQKENNHTHATPTTKTDSPTQEPPPLLRNPEPEDFFNLSAHIQSTLMFSSMETCTNACLPPNTCVRGNLMIYCTTHCSSDSDCKEGYVCSCKDRLHCTGALTPTPARDVCMRK